MSLRGKGSRKMRNHYTLKGGVGGGPSYSKKRAVGGANHNSSEGAMGNLREVSLAKTDRRRRITHEQGGGQEMTGGGCSGRGGKQ